MTLHWDDLEWALNSWQAEGPVEWNSQGKWFQLKLTKDDQDQNPLCFLWAPFQSNTHLFLKKGIFLGY